MKWLGKILVIPILFIGLLIFIKSIDYFFSPDFANGFLSDKKILFTSAYKYVFYAHIISAPIALLIGTFQVFLSLRKKRKKLHIVFGKLYVFIMLLVCTPSGIIMSFFAFGGLYSRLSFFLLSMLAFIFTFIGFKTIKVNDNLGHRKNITRSYLLVLSAIFLRILSFVCVHYFNWNGENMYIIIAWSSWLLPLFIYELRLAKI